MVVAIEWIRRMTVIASNLFYTLLINLAYRMELLRIFSHPLLAAPLSLGPLYLPYL